MAGHFRAKVYRDVAQSLREQAAKTTCPGVRIQMFYSARSYDLMAESIDRSARKNPDAISNVACFPGPPVEREAVLDPSTAWLQHAMRPADPPDHLVDAGALQVSD